MSGSSEADTKHRQNAFLAAHRLVGTITKAANAVDIPRNTVTTWIFKDKHGFRKKYYESKAEFGEFLEDLALERIKNQKPGDNPMLLIQRLNAEMPSKYRRDASIAEAPAKELMAELRKFFKDYDKKDREAAKENEVSTSSEIEQQQAIQEAQKILARKSNDNSDEQT